MSGVFVEDPWTRIIGGKRKRKKEPPPPPDRGPPYCGRYGWGAIMAFVEASIIAPTPYGPNQFAPFVGTFWTNQTNFVGDLEVGALQPSIPDPPTMNGYADHAYNVFLGQGLLTFTTTPLFFLNDEHGKHGIYGWLVPLAYGQNSDGIPIVIKSYTINMAWGGGSDLATAEWGLGICHPLPTVSLAEPVKINPPPTPVMVIGSGPAASGSYIYDFQYERWANGQSIVNEGNQFDPSLGGPAYLWWMLHQGSTWKAYPGLMANMLGGEGSWYTWEIIAECQTMPDFNPYQ